MKRLMSWERYRVVDADNRAMFHASKYETAVSYLSQFSLVFIVRNGLSIVAVS